MGDGVGVRLVLEKNGGQTLGLLSLKTQTMAVTFMRSAVSEGRNEVDLVIMLSMLRYSTCLLAATNCMCFLFLSS